MKIKLLLTFLAAFFSTNLWADQKLSVEVSNQSAQKWHFNRLTAYQSDNEVHISGRLNSDWPGILPKGHVDIAAYSPSGQLLAETTTNYVPAILTRTIKRRGGVRFSVTLQDEIPADAVVKVAFHREKPVYKTKPTHSGNIAQ